MASIESLLTLPADRAITFANEGDLEKFVALNNAEGGHPRARVLQEFGHFVWSLDGERACLNASTWSMNHAGEGPGGGRSVHVYERASDGAMVGEAVGDLAAGAELRNDYRAFDLPRWYLEYCAANGFSDVRSAVLAAVGGL